MGGFGGDIGRWDPGLGSTGLEQARAMTFTHAYRSVLIGAGILAALSVASPLSAKERPAPAPQPQAHGGQPVQSIAAVVNDDVITARDFEARYRLALLSMNLQDRPEIRARLETQVRRALIDEKLQMQEARRVGITISDKELETALAKIAEQNKMPANNLERFLGQAGVPIGTLVDQVRANLSWSKLVQRRLRPTVIVGEEEIDAAVERLRANAGKTESLVSEIFLGVDGAGRDEEVRRNAERLIEQIRQGAPFALVARQFSQAAGAGNGGDIGWVQPGQLPEELDQALVRLRPGTLSPPLRAADGYHILAVREQRPISAGDPGDVHVRLKLAAFPLRPGGDVKAQLGRIVDQISRTQGCENFESAAKSAGSDKVQTMGPMRVGDLSADLARAATVAPVGQASPPFGNERQANFMMVCERKAGGTDSINRDAIYNRIGGERLDMLQRRLLTDLNRAAYVDVRR